MKSLKKSKAEASEIKLALSTNDNGKYTYNIAIHNVDNNVTTTINGTSLAYAMEVFKKLETTLKKNVVEGTKINGSHRNSRTTDKKITNI